ncbi:MAG: endonuclease III domain-containing protein [Nitrospirae bacterium]|nr:endonuclease III domain-containing protein [Nitrospirota bacterium]
MKRNVLETIYSRLFQAFGPQHWWPGDSPFEIAVGAILTQNTNWANVEKAIDNLKRDKSLSPTKLHRMSALQLAGLIRPAGYFNIKAKRLKNFLDLLHEEYKGSMHKMRDDSLANVREKLLSVNGIGPETADSITLYALEKPVFVIDAYTKRILSRHTIFAHDASYETYQELFHEGLRKDVSLFNEYHALLVRLAKDFCRPAPRCPGCPLEGI